jgi:uncharacterized membrane protein YraQ (UPF0718 family)
MWQSAQTIFLSIVLEALPFVVLGVMISSLIQTLVSQERMMSLLPKNGALSVVGASLLGLVLPVCDCGTIPVARSLIRKGVPVSAAMAFTLSAPVINPLTMIATFVAFGFSTTMMWARVAATFGIAVVIGWVLLAAENRRKAADATKNAVGAAALELPMLETAATTNAPRPRRSPGEVFRHVINHAVIEFFEVGVFVVISAAVAALLQTFMPASVTQAIGDHPVLSVLVMMALAIILSLCSEADAFVARSLASLTTGGGVLGFLVIGQMIDLRNILLLPRVYDRWVVARTFGLAIVLTFAVGVGVNVLDLL